VREAHPAFIARRGGKPAGIHDPLLDARSCSAPHAPAQGEPLGSNDETRRWSGTLPTSGTCVVQVHQMRAQARRGEKAPHSLTVAIR